MAPRNVWVANLPPECDEALLRDLFAEFGPIQATKVFTDCPKGVCGLVLFKDPGDALRAVTFMHEFPLQGQRLVVQLAINNRLSQYENGPQGTNIWVGNLPPDYTEDALRSLMSAYGSVSSLRLLEREPTAAPRALAAMVNFSTVEEAARALEALNGQPLGPRAKPLVLKYASPPPFTPSNEATGSLAALQLASGNDANKIAKNAGRDVVMPQDLRLAAELRGIPIPDASQNGGTCSSSSREVDNDEEEDDGDAEEEDLGDEEAEEDEDSNDAMDEDYAEGDGDDGEEEEEDEAAEEEEEEEEEESDEDSDQEVLEEESSETASAPPAP